MQEWKNSATFAPATKQDGAIAQLVEQRTENPCVPGSIPGGTTPPFINAARSLRIGRLFYALYLKRFIHNVVHNLFYVVDN